MSIVDDIRIKQVFDPKGAKGGYRFEILPDEDTKAQDPPIAPGEPSPEDGITELKGAELVKYLTGLHEGLTDVISLEEKVVGVVFPPLPTLPKDPEYLFGNRDVWDQLFGGGGYA